MSGAAITVVATEETELDYRKIHGDEPPLTAYTAEHVFTFERTGAGWTLTAHRAASTDGLAPVTEVSVETQSTGPNADPGAAGTTRPAGPLSPGDKPSESSGGAASKATATAIPAGLNYQAMVSYAVAHWGGASAPSHSGTLSVLQDNIPKERAIFFLRNKGETDSIDFYRFTNDDQGLLREFDSRLRISPTGDDHFLTDLNGEPFADILARVIKARGGS